MPRIATPRLLLVPMSPAALRGAAAGWVEPAALPGVELPSDWGLDPDLAGQRARQADAAREVVFEVP